MERSRFLLRTCLSGLVISYVLDLPFGHGQKYLAGSTGAKDKLVSGWGLDGVTTFQRGFPLKITWAGASTPLEAAGFGISNIRPDVIAGCSKGGSRSPEQVVQYVLLRSAAGLGLWYRVARGCYTARKGNQQL